MVSIQSTIDLRFLRIRQTHLVWHLYDGIPDIFNKLDSLRDTQAEDARRGQRAHEYLGTIESASIQWPFAERSRTTAERSEVGWSGSLGIFNVPPNQGFAASSSGLLDLPFSFVPLEDRCSPLV
jgi:hypothetical protein